MLFELPSFVTAFLAYSHLMNVLSDGSVARKGLAYFDNSVRLDVLRTAPTP